MVGAEFLTEWAWKSNGHMANRPWPYGYLREGVEKA